MSILKMFLRAERSGDWNLHLATIRQMVHLFAATGQTNYAKCARLYIEMMTNLPNTHPDICLPCVLPGTVLCVWIHSGYVVVCISVISQRISPQLGCAHAQPKRGATNRL